MSYFAKLKDYGESDKIDYEKEILKATEQFNEKLKILPESAAPNTGASTSYDGELANPSPQGNSNLLFGWGCNSDIEDCAVGAYQPVGIEAILQQRGNRYGQFKDHARITQNIKRAMTDSTNWSKLPDEMAEALEMIAHKIGRILNGSYTYKDSWTDLIGYASLIEKELED